MVPAVTVIVFQLLLQFGGTLRVLRMAGARPVGAVDNAATLHSRLKPGQRLLETLPLTRSLGLRLRDDPETFEWAYAAGDRVQVELVGGRLAAWRPVRAPVAGFSDTAEPAGIPARADPVAGTDRPDPTAQILC